LAFVVNPDSLKLSDEFSEVDREFARVSVVLLKQMGEQYQYLTDKLIHYGEEENINNQIEDISDLFNDNSVLPLGHILNGRYKIINTLGKGGFGIVYKVEDIKTKEIFAIKELFIYTMCFRGRKNHRVHFKTNFKIKEFKQKFHQTVNLFQNINNNNLVRIYNAFEENNTIYSRMEYIDGKNLNILRNDKKWKMDEEGAIDLLNQLFHGLKEIHTKNIIHRDINPTNIIKENSGIYKIVDFTSIRTFDKNKLITEITAIGTATYMAPELSLTHGKIDIFSDIYSLGITMYALLSKDSEIPTTVDRLIDDTLENKIDSLSISYNFKNILKKMTELKAENRFQSLEEIENNIVSEHSIKKYKAFLCYSHGDTKFVTWLHSELEKYKIPKKLYTDYPHLPKTLYPIFRDEYELKSGDDFAVEIFKALRDSESLIVVCSINSAKSVWVHKEIIDFKMMHGEDRIFPIIIDGEPFAREGDKFEDSLECLPEALKYKVDTNGNLTNERTNLFASGMIGKEDGRNFLKFKLIAGILGISFRELYEEKKKNKWFFQHLSQKI
jgi:serine/threonine protein kinase